MSNTADFTQGSILKKLCRFMLPVLGALILQAAYGAVDLLVVGRFGSTSGLSAVSTGSQVLNLVTFVVTQLAMGVTVLIARYIGEKREKEIGAVLGGAAVVFTILAGCLFVLLVLFARPISVLMQAPQEALALTASYVRICGCGILFIVAYNVLSAVFRGLGDSRSPLLFVLVACLVNVAGDLVLVAGLHLDAAGAALATVIGQIFGMALGLWGVFRHQKVLNVNMKAFKWNRGTVGDIYRVGLPGIVMQSVVSVMTAGMNGILIAFSQTAVNVLGVYFKLQTFVFMPVFGLNQGALPVMGYNYGARNRRRLMGAYRITLTAAVVIMALGLVLFQLLPEQMLMLFVDRTDAAAAQEMIEVGVPALRIISLSFLGAAFGIINSTLFQATARGMNSLIVSVCRQLVVILPAAWILGQQFGLNAVWYAFPIAEVASFFISYILLWREYRTELRFLGTEKEKKA